MMRQNRSWLAAVLIGAGMLFLIDRFAWAAGISNIFWSLLFFGLAAVLVWLYRSDAARWWWALFPAFAALAAALAVVAGNTGGLVLLALCGALALVIYIRDPERRWALLAGGALLSLALMAFFELLFPPADNGWWLFLGLAITCLALYLRRAAGTGSWYLIATVALGAMALLALFTGRIVETLIAIVLLASGALLLWRDASNGRLAAGGRPPLPVAGPPTAANAATPEPPTAPATPSDPAAPVAGDAPPRPRWWGRSRRARD